jgi:hypothetical protein
VRLVHEISIPEQRPFASGEEWVERWVWGLRWQLVWGSQQHSVL